MDGEQFQRLVEAEAQRVAAHIGALNRTDHDKLVGAFIDGVAFEHNHMSGLLADAGFKVVAVERIVPPEGS